MSTTRQKSQRFESEYPSKSKLDLHNPDQAKQANKDVVAFLKWLDEKRGAGDTADVWHELR